MSTLTHSIGDNVVMPTTISAVIVYVHTFLSLYYLDKKSHNFCHNCDHDKWSLNFCLHNCDSLKMSKTKVFFSYSNSLQSFSISLPLPSFSPSFSHASAFSFSKFRISIRSWPRLSPSSMRNNPAMMKGRSRLWCLINWLATAPPNLMDFNLCATFYALLRYSLLPLVMLSHLVSNLAMCLSGGTAALLQHSSPAGEL